jgi:hypothetical protein
MGNVKRTATVIAGIRLPKDEDHRNPRTRLLDGAGDDALVTSVGETKNWRGREAADSEVVLELSDAHIVGLQ